MSKAEIKVSKKLARQINKHNRKALLDCLDFASESDEENAQSYAMHSLVSLASKGWMNYILNTYDITVREATSGFAKFIADQVITSYLDSADITERIKREEMAAALPKDLKAFLDKFMAETGLEPVVFEGGSIDEILAKVKGHIESENATKH